MLCVCVSYDELRAPVTGLNSSHVIFTVIECSITRPTSAVTRATYCTVLGPYTELHLHPTDVEVFNGAANLTR